ncbi:MAG: hypothetical protein BWY21_01762 [Parcubacteria group bacterium ADurb.Bin216]|nr:MAG: hypothetical protein BWY21_01762 [Parcubacteria group bacterium ADurb.Bin216]
MIDTKVYLIQSLCGIGFDKKKMDHWEKVNNASKEHQPLADVRQLDVKGK